MNNEDFIKLAIVMAAKCRPSDSKTIPKVGAVIAVGEQIVAAASRGEEYHAERIALEEARLQGADLTQATVYTTLEPCVEGVRRRTLDSCADRLVAASVKKVVIGIHDPNKDVTGKGFLRLQEAGIETELFPKAFAQKVKEINDEFIRAQQSLAIKITYPANKASLETEPGGKITLRGRWINRPDPPDNVYAIAIRGDVWWPQQPLRPVTRTEEEWETVVYIGNVGLHKVLVGKLNPLGKTLLNYYRRVVDENKKRTERLRVELKNLKFEPPWNPWIGINVEGGDPPKGIDREDEIEFTVTKIVPAKT